VAKSPEAFRTISEASEELGVAQHVLRFWETKFSFVRPMKRAGGRRFYRPQDIAVLATVRRLLHDEGYTIRGVQKLHREHGVKPQVTGAAPRAPAPRAPPAPAPSSGDIAPRLTGDVRGRLEETLVALIAAKDRLDALIEGD
jgi:DNA-binding transcriptional MerR regulator